jgi:DNA mismatch repair protein MutL
MEAYSGRLMKGKFPLSVLFVALRHDQVDVNVHPTKSSVRFAAPKPVHDSVVRAVSEGLKRFDRPAWGQVPDVTPSRRQVPYKLTRIRGSVSEPRPELSPVHHGGAREFTQPLFPEKTFSSLRVIGQLHNTYIICESRDGMVLIDQHAAHERVVFESLKAAYTESAIVTQGLLVPETIELSHREADILETLLNDLRNMGIEIEPFGGKTFLIKSVPALLAGKPVKPLIMEVLEKAADIDLLSDIDQGVDACLAIMACHGAIRANQQLGDEQIRALLKQMDEVPQASRCPHGRPTLIHQSLYKVEKDFKRIV